MENMDIFNIVIIVFFAVALVWLGKMLITMKKKVIIYGRFISASRILFAVAGVMSVASLTMYHELWDIIRSVLIAIVVVLFICLRDGLCEDGFFVTGTFVPFTEIDEWDIATYKKKTTVFYGHVDPKDKKKGKHEVFHSSLIFDASKANEIEKYLKGAIGKKYKRIKKDK